tara:strand:- start:10060 stop:10233 length:174 start_codon:yes stop_codon:yes gene_type:complete
MAKELIVEFRRELVRGISKMNDDTFYTKLEIKQFIDKCYGEAKDRARAEEDTIEDVE